MSEKLQKLKDEYRSFEKRFYTFGSNLVDYFNITKRFKIHIGKCIVNFEKVASTKGKIEIFYNNKTIMKCNTLYDEINFNLSDIENLYIVEDVLTQYMEEGSESAVYVLDKAKEFFKLWEVLK